jgi:uncharacterized repeat protein (TIGR01451 family)
LFLLAVALLAWPVASSAIGQRQEGGRAQQQPSPIGDQKAGSILVYNFYNTDNTRTDTETQISLGNTHPSRNISVRLYFISQSSCAAKDATICLAAGQTRTFRASDYDPRGSGYVVAVAMDAATGLPVSHNFLVGSEDVRMAGGYGGQLTAVAITALFEGTLRGTRDPDAAAINFDGQTYSRIPRTLAYNSLTSAADGNDTIVVVNRIGGNLAGKIDGIGALSGVVSDSRGKFAFKTRVDSCQMQSSLGDLLPNLNAAVPAGKTAALEIASDGGDIGLFGVVLTANARNASLAGARNFDSSSPAESDSLLIPIKPSAEQCDASRPAAGANLELTMTADPPLSVVRGNNITYTLNSLNRGFDSATNVFIRDTIQNGATFVSATASAGGTCATPPVGSPGSVVCAWSGTTGFLVTRTATVVVRVSETLPSGSEIVNVGETQSATNDPNPSNNTRTIRTTVTSTANELVIATQSLPNARLGVPYSHTMMTVNGVQPLVWSIVGGTLPQGLVLGANGEINGAATQTGLFPVTIRVIDGDFRMAQRAYTMRSTTQSLLVKADFDNDSRTDLSVWRGSTGDWLTISSTTGSLQVTNWGLEASPFNDKPVAGDYDGDGKADVAVWRPLNGNWFILNSSNGSVRVEPFGQSGDMPVPGDYDGDARLDLAVWRGSTGVWHIKQSSDGAVKEVAWGSSNAPYFDVPAQGDYDGDGKTDPTVWRGHPGVWYILRSTDGTFQQVLWGSSAAAHQDLPVANDYDGDGKVDVAVWRRTTGRWFILSTLNGGMTSLEWGNANAPFNDIATPGDYDGDGKTDIAVWRSATGTWFIIRSTDGGFTVQTHGQTGDTPIPQ